MSPLRFVSWNVNARRDSAGQAGAIAALQPDVVALQEVTPAAVDRFRDAFAAHGVTYFLVGTELATRAGQSQVAARAVLLASRWPLRPCEPAVVPRRELVVCATAETAAGPIEVVAAHIPTSTNGKLQKLETQEGVASRVRNCSAPGVLLGDFNAPKEELPDGTVVPFTARGDIRACAAELGLTGPALGDCGFVDVFRAANGYAADDRSWYWKNRGRTGGFRLDHVFASDDFRPVACWYEHELRKRGLSDHAPIVADLELRG